jgi:hypothetical protein
MDTDFECLDIQPDAKSFHLLLDCVGKVVESDPLVWPAQILDEMEMRYQSGDELVKPNQETFQRVILASLRIGDVEGAVKFAGKMIALGWVPPVTLYSRILKRLAAVSNGSSFLAKLTDELWKQMRKLESSHHDFRPTPDCYARAMEVWQQSGSRLSNQRIVELRKKMKQCVSQNS